MLAGLTALDNEDLDGLGAVPLVTLWMFLPVSRAVIERVVEALDLLYVALILRTSMYSRLVCCWWCCRSTRCHCPPRTGSSAASGYQGCVDGVVMDAGWRVYHCPRLLAQQNRAVASIKGLVPSLAIAMPCTVEFLQSLE